MKDLISRDVLIAEYEWLKSQVSACSVAEVEEHIERIRNAPAVEAEPIIHAHWEYVLIDGVLGRWRCSACEKWQTRKSKRCPECGAHMDGEATGE